MSKKNIITISILIIVVVFGGILIFINNKNSMSKIELSDIVISTPDIPEGSVSGSIAPGNNESKNYKINSKISTFTNLYPEKTTQKNLKYISTNSSVATVDSKGIITAVSVGSAKVYAVSVDNEKIISNELEINVVNE